MNAWQKILESLYIAGAIAIKDIGDALKNKYMRTNLLLMAVMPIFFYYIGTARPWDKNASIVVYDLGSNHSLQDTRLADGAEYSFFSASSLQDMEQKMANRDLGLVIPADFDQVLAAGGIPELQAYVFWVQRGQVSQLESRYTQAFSEIIGAPVQVYIGGNIVIPQANTTGSQASVAALMIYFIFWTAMALVPNLMMEERRTKTMDALLVSPASPGQVVLGKAMAGAFYVGIIGGLAFALNWRYLTHVGIAILAFMGFTLLSIGLALVLGSFNKNPQQLAIWSLVLILFLVVPALFYTESNLKSGIRAVFTWMPSSVLATIYRYACSTGIPLGMLGLNLAVALACTALVYSLVVWQVHQADR